MLETLIVVGVAIIFIVIFLMPLFLFFVLLPVILGAVPLYLLWNWILADALAISKITFWQALMVSFLLYIMVKIFN